MKMRTGPSRLTLAPEHHDGFSIQVDEGFKYSSRIDGFCARRLDISLAVKNSLDHGPAASATRKPRKCRLGYQVPPPGHRFLEKEAPHAWHEYVTLAVEEKPSREKQFTRPNGPLGHT